MDQNRKSRRSMEESVSFLPLLLPLLFPGELGADALEYRLSPARIRSSTTLAASADRATLPSLTGTPGKPLPSGAGSTSTRLAASSLHPPPVANPVTLTQTTNNSTSSKP